MDHLSGKTYLIHKTTNSRWIQLTMWQTPELKLKLTLWSWAFLSRWIGSSTRFHFIHGVPCVSKQWYALWLSCKVIFPRNRRSRTTTLDVVGALLAETSGGQIPRPFQIVAAMTSELKTRHDADGNYLLELIFRCGRRHSEEVVQLRIDNVRHSAAVSAVPAAKPTDKESKPVVVEADLLVFCRLPVLHVGPSECLTRMMRK